MAVLRTRQAGNGPQSAFLSKKAVIIVETDSTICITCFYEFRYRQSVDGLVVICGSAREDLGKVMARSRRGTRAADRGAG